MPKKKKAPDNFKLVYLEDIIPEYSSEYSIASIYRMLPCAVDGLKPIQRKILWTMYKGKVFGHKDKCSSIVGDVAKYLTTGDDSVYPALTKLGQSFRNTHLPIDIQGNQGYITDNKEPAAKRYTEAEISKYGLDMYFDEDIEFTKYIKNYNGTLEEPLILPTLLPMSLICGNKGTATGYTNHILPHDMKSIAKCYIRYLETLSGKHSIKTFDKFLEKNIKLGIPNKAKIMNENAIAKGLLTNSAKVYMEGIMEIEDASYGRKLIRITELPYEVSVVQFIDSIKGKGASDIFSSIADYSDSVIDIHLVVKKDVNIDTAIEYIYLKSPFRKAYNYTMHFTLMGTDDDKLVRRMNIINIFDTHYKFKSECTKKYLEHKKEELMTKYDCLAMCKIIFTNEKNKRDFFKIVNDSKKNEVRNKLKSRFNTTLNIIDYILNKKITSLVNRAEELTHELEKIEGELKITTEALKDINTYLINKIKAMIKKY